MTTRARSELPPIDVAAPDASGRPVFAAACSHCRCPSDQTPTMRHGPAGAWTLCNACGLAWSRGYMRDLSRAAPKPALKAAPKKRRAPARAAAAEGSAAVVAAQGRSGGSERTTAAMPTPQARPQARPPRGSRRRGAQLDGSSGSSPFASAASSPFSPGTSPGTVTTSPPPPRGRSGVLSSAASLTLLGRSSSLGSAAGLPVVTTGAPGIGTLEAPGGATLDDSLAALAPSLSLASSTRSEELFASIMMAEIVDGGSHPSGAVPGGGTGEMGAVAPAAERPAVFVPCGGASGSMSDPTLPAPTSVVVGQQVVVLAAPPLR